MLQFRLGRLRLICLATVAALSASTSVIAEDTRPATADIAALDELLDHHRFNDLAKALANVNVNARADWLRDRLSKGRSIFLAAPYITTLWRAGVATNEPDPSKDLRITAAAIWLYTYFVTVVDGIRCDDPTAPQNRKTQFLTGYRPVFEFIKAATPETRNSVIDTALQMEKSSAPRRANDHFLCSGGLAETQAALSQSGNGKQTVGELAQQSKDGRTVTLPAALGYVPKFAEPGTYENKQNEVRETLRDRAQSFFR